MKASELRVGNFVTIDNPKHHPSIKGKPLIVLAIDEIDEPKCSLICTDPKENLIIPAYSQFLKFIQPIPLTAEWLEKFRFNKFPNQKKYDMDNFWACGLRNGNEWHFEDLECIVKYVHQLQNLYFALAGEELTIREDAK